MVMEFTAAVNWKENFEPTVYKHYKMGSMIAKKYSVIVSGVSCMLRESHQLTVSTKEEEM